MDTLLLSRHELSMKDVPLLGTIFVASALFWGLCYFIGYLYMHNFKKDCKYYHNLPNGEKALYLSRVPAMLHAIAASALAYVVIFHTW
jgi:hypothetical protein